MNFENRLENRLEHWFDLPLNQKIKTGCTLIACCLLGVFAVIALMGCIYVLPELITEI